MATISHPFMNNPEPIEFPEEHEKSVDEVCAW